MKIYLSSHCLAAPVVFSEDNMLTAILMGTVELSFTISDAQPPVTEEDVTWYFLSYSDGSGLEPNMINSNTSDRYLFSYTSTNTQLRIHPVELMDEGSYIVAVSNIAGSDSYTVSVDVVSKSNNLYTCEMTITEAWMI